MKKLALLSVFLLTGCATPVPVTMKFPAVPAELKMACPDLDKVPEDTAQLSEMMKVVVNNYSKYHECRLKADAWIEWYDKQKQISDEVTKK